ncbi:Hsp20/alpha crystallin family protein [Thermomicrobiaceae bacterium CFH 74404]|uniref:Hsp20/alpha crystallin family protein n=3 Tax=Thermomicrobia TaxID=189775 RepID=A0AA42BE91_9BACT|nr:Hsp20/alpha crystallin family protein [Thermalbibacter longus]MCM8750543.1 Hsp20/alpha crystallin family protein [Thermalbibacter longus]
MSITSWSPLRELETLRERLDRLVSELTGREGGALGIPLDIQETTDAVIVRASLPGYRPEDIAVEINQGVLTIRGESREEREETGATWHLRERRVGSVYRAVTLPAPVQEDEAQASFEHGVLEIRLPKTAPAPQRRIPIQVRS